MELGVEPGDWINIDELKRELNKKGYDADYENLYDGTAGFFAEMTVEDGDEAAIIYVDADITGQMVKDIQPA